MIDWTWIREANVARLAQKRAVVREPIGNVPRA